jgi:hypothetical protein
MNVLAGVMRTSLTDNICEGELLYVRDGSKHDTKGLT